MSAFTNLLEFYRKWYLYYLKFPSLLISEVANTCTLYRQSNSPPCRNYTSQLQSFIPLGGSSLHRSDKLSQEMWEQTNGWLSTVTPDCAPTSLTGSTFRFESVHFQLFSCKITWDRKKEKENERLIWYTLLSFLYAQGCILCACHWRRKLRYNLKAKVRCI